MDEYLDWYNTSRISTTLKGLSRVEGRIPSPGPHRLVFSYAVQLSGPSSNLGYPFSRR
ncbi:IS3 family transposase [Streptomyces sp. NPDC093544]|uniref:IS3 family transposase n=1 Tax=Streptomyces sp. NPDC093544 TaxID=3155200 RepID=UPI0034366254